MAEIDAEELRTALFELMKWVRVHGTAQEYTSNHLAEQVRTRISRALRVLPKCESAPEVPLLHDWREYRRTSDVGSSVRRFLCARCGGEIVEEGLSSDFKATDFTIPCKPERTVWIDESPLKETA